MSTFNRSALLEAALERLVRQRTAVPYELVVVDNNSTDATPAVVSRVSRRAGSLLRPAFEARQGVSYGRNTGIRLARAPIVAFTDDDVLVGPEWVDEVARTMEAHPEADCVGGRVLPIWSTPPPPWVTRAHWSPLALVDYGDAPFYVNRKRQVCLVTANVAYRRAALDAIGWFSADFPRCQDREVLLRLWQSGRQGLYCPSLVVQCEVPPERLTWTYHRRWHLEHGHFCASMPDHLPGADGDGGGLPRRMLFGAPGALYRELAMAVIQYLRARVLGHRAAALKAEAYACYLFAFIRSRARTWRRDGHGLMAEVSQLARVMLSRSRRGRAHVPAESE